MRAPEWSPAARDDFREIIRYIARRNPSDARRMRDLINEKANQLVESPAIGRLGLEEGTRELIAHPNYILVYEVGQRGVRIVALHHAAQRWP